MVFANIKALSFTEPELLLMEVFPILTMQILCIFAKNGESKKFYV